MKVRNVLGLAVTATALTGLLAQPSVAAAPAMVTFAGTIQLTPTPTGVQQVVEYCFSVDLCTNGAGAGAVASPDAIDELRVKLTHQEACATGTVIQPRSVAAMEIRVHDAVSGQYRPPVQARWTRTGLAIAFDEGATGAAVLTPIGVPVCGSPVTFAISGAIELVS